MTKPRPNVALLDATLAEVRRAARRKRRRWYQGAWRKDTPCGTAMCFAGWAVTLDGAEWAPGEQGGVRVLLTARPGERVPGPERKVYGPGVVPVWTRARQVLGLTPQEADDLFFPTNSLRDLTAQVNKIKVRAESENPDD